MPATTFHTETKKNCVIIRVDGYLDGESGPELQRMVEEFLCRGVRGFVFEFSRCANINSLGVSSLLDAALRVVEDFGGNLAVTGLNEIQRKVLILSGIIPLAVAAPTLVEACRVTGGDAGDDGGAA
ncbi:MAG TPA: STAS domain-containing protein [Candidatus Ozemobacteraceae bacterium]|nr:STAS domain-containing protein [Candidatus Ozemobacteraceae bacterium]